jgi:hypothetical protein
VLCITESITRTDLILFVRKEIKDSHLLWYDVVPMGKLLPMF